MVIPIFKGKGDAMSCGAYRGMKLLEHAMKIVEKGLKKRLQSMVKLDKMQLDFMPGKGMNTWSLLVSDDSSKGMIDAMFIMRSL